MGISEGEGDCGDDVCSSVVGTGAGNGTEDNGPSSMVKGCDEIGFCKQIDMIRSYTDTNLHTCAQVYYVNCMQACMFNCLHVCS